MLGLKPKRAGGRFRNVRNEREECLVKICELVKGVWAKEIKELIGAVSEV